jgi:hypothetical protein
MHVQPLRVVVEETLASADPYYRGPHRSSPPPLDAEFRPLDPAKTLRDLGRLEEEPAAGQLPR